VLPYPLADVLDHLGADKKHRGGRLRWVLPTADGYVVRDDVDDDLVRDVAAGLLSPTTVRGAA
jgi:3-dehydroquinate synthetase